MLTKWCPDKLAALVQDVVNLERKSTTQLKTQYQSAEKNWERTRSDMDQLISHCKTVCIS